MKNLFIQIKIRFHLGYSNQSCDGEREEDDLHDESHEGVVGEGVGPPHVSPPVFLVESSDDEPLHHHVLGREEEEDGAGQGEQLEGEQYRAEN